jgi:Fur family ferric uptake transcriptional regulator
MARLNRHDARKALRDAGLRATAPRVAVLQLLDQAKKPVSHSDVVEALGDETWDQATLYRNLLKLVEVNMARVASRASGITRYERALPDDGPHHHPHFACSDCGNVLCLPGVQVKVTPNSKWGPAIRDAELQVVGSCPDCRKRKPRSRRPSTRARDGRTGEGRRARA